MFKFILILIILITSCADFDEDNLYNNAYYCHTNEHKRDCNNDEKNFIDNMRSILSEIRNFSPSNWNNFYKKEQKSLTRKVYFFGENHDHAIAQMQNLAAINSLANNGITILLEGNSRKLDPRYKCGMNLVFDIYQAWQWEKQGQHYDAKIRMEWLKQQNFAKLYYSTYKSFYIKDLNLEKMTCYFWDDIDALKRQSNIETLKIRNKSMTQSIEEHIKNNTHTPLVITTGLSHMPLGEYLLYSKSKNIYDIYTIKNFYKNLSNYNYYGHSSVIYYYLYNNNINYTEYIHKSFLNY